MGPTALLTSFLIAYFCFILYRYVTRKKPILPPGPRPDPLLGHTLQLPSKKVWKYFQELGKEYGPLVRLSLAGDEFLILNSIADVDELLNKRSANYSSRKPLVYAGKYLSDHRRTLLLSYGDTLKMHRSIFHQMLMPKAINTYDQNYEYESLGLINDLLSPSTASSPLLIENACQHYASSLIFTLAYGRRMSTDEFEKVVDVVETFVKDCAPGAHIVDTFPILDFLPNWILRLPSLGFRKSWREEALEKHEYEAKLYKGLLMEVKRDIDQGKHVEDCFASKLLRKGSKPGFDLEDMVYVAGTAFEAGSETTSGALLWFLMAMVLHSDKFKRAQSEIDSIVGKSGDTMPTLAHIDELPYCVAVMKEALRWMPVIPAGFPHMSDVEDEYQGYYIPAKTSVVANIWSLSHDPAEFEDPYAFKPERFLHSSADGSRPSLNPETLSTGQYVFGFGRRICPGRHLASKSLWIAATRIIWAFDIGYAYEVDEKTGNRVRVEVDPEKCVSSSITTKPEPFKFSITPRSERHAETIRREWQNYVGK